MATDTKEERSSILRDERKRNSFREKWQNREFRGKICQSLGICVSFIALGLNDGQIGPTLLDLQILTHTDLVKASTYISAGAVGGLSGAILCGLVYGKTNPNLLIVLAVLMEGIATMVTPFCFYYELMLFIRYATFFFGGILNTSGNALMMCLWGTEGEQWMQFLHFCYALGGVLSPAYSAPFLAPNNPGYVENTELNNSALVNSSSDFLPNDGVPIVNGQSNVKHAFMISSVLTILMSLPLLFFHVKNHESSHEQERPLRKEQRKLPRGIIIFNTFWVCTLFMNYVFLEGSFIAFLFTFLVREFERYSKSRAAFALAFHWACFATGRLSMVFLSKVFSPVQLLAMSSSLLVATFTSFLILAENGIVDVLLGPCALAGLGFSAVYASTMSWIEAEILSVTGKVTGVIMVFYTLANVINPLIFGHFMQDVSNMWFCYLLLGGAVLFVCNFSAILVYSRCYLNQRIGPNGPQLESKP